MPEVPTRSLLRNSVICISLICTLLLSTTLIYAQYPEPGAQTWWAPDSGKYWVTNYDPLHGFGWALSWDIVWDADAEKFDATHEYQHEFRTPATGYARWIDWDSDLPCAYPYVDEPEDEFSVSSREPYNIIPGRQYFTVIYLEPEEPDVTTAEFDLEAELQHVLLRIPCWYSMTYAVAGYDILASFTAPAIGSWSSSSSGGDSGHAEAEREVKIVDIEEYAKEAHATLEKLASESPDAISLARIRFSSPMIPSEVDEILRRYGLRPVYVRGVLPTVDPLPQFGGRVLPTDGSVESVIERIKERTFALFDAAQREYERTGDPLFKSAAEAIQPRVDAFKNGDARVVEVAVEGTFSSLWNLAQDDDVLLVDVIYLDYIEMVVEG